MKMAIFRDPDDDAAFAERQGAFYSRLSSFVNGNPGNLADLIRLGFHDRLFFRRHAVASMEDHAELVSLTERTKNDSSEVVEIPVYRGGNPQVARLATLLGGEIKESLVGAYVHGSVATNEECAYSDLDGLVILRNCTFSSRKKLALVARALYKAQSIMFEFDPLQHHGWFVLTEADLDHFPEHYFPLNVLRRSRSIFPDWGVTLRVSRRPVERRWLLKPFITVARAVARGLSDHHRCSNCYELKSVMSGIMLLPALYVGARDGEGICKEDSFAEARRDFSREEWSIVEEVSSIRTNWECRLGVMRRYMFVSAHPLSRVLAKRWAPSLPEAFRHVTSEGFRMRTNRLIGAMSRKLGYSL